MIGRILALALATLLAACASTPTVNTDFDAEADFGSYRSYSWVEADGALMPQGIVQGIDARLQARGWKRVADGQVHVAAHVTTRDGQTYNTFYSGIGHDLRWLGVSGARDSVTLSVDNYRAGTLVVDMFDGRSRRAIWRARAEGMLPDDPTRLEATVQRTLDRMFADFPPGSRAGR